MSELANRPGYERVGTGRFDAFLRRLLSIKGVVSPDVEPKLQPGIDLTRAPWELAELAVLAGWRGYQVYTSEPATALLHSILQLQNRAGSGILCVVESFAPWSSCTPFIIDTIPATLFGGAASSTLSRLDTRAGAPNLAGTCVATHVAAASQTYTSWPIDGNGSFPPYRGPWIISPGFGLQVQSNSVNNEVAGTFRYWERAGEQSELVAF